MWNDYQCDISGCQNLYHVVESGERIPDISEKHVSNRIDMLLEIRYLIDNGTGEKRSYIKYVITVRYFFKDMKKRKSRLVKFK